MQAGIFAVSGLPLSTTAARIHNERLKFIVDTGASVSLLPSSAAKGFLLQPSVVHLMSANGSKIECHGEIHTSLIIPGLRRQFN